MTSEDVIHSLYIPAFRIKKDVVPGRYTKMFFRATQPGEYVLLCTQYCGTGHSSMMAQVVVHRPGEFEKWRENAASFVERLSPAEAGKRLFSGRGCQTCHSLDGTRLVGPTFKGLFGSTVPLSDGGRVAADENYIRESILSPAARIVATYDPVMPTYQGRIKDKEITALIEYIKTVK
jgi:cytochrome c oxidase subunit 2